MKILLIYPKPNISFDTTHCVSLGLAYMAAVLEKEGHFIRCLDLNVEQDNLENEAKNYDFFGLYVITPAFKSALKIAERIKGINQNSIISFGGPFSTAMPDECLESEFVDIVVSGEGENTMKELCDKLSKNLPINNVKGICYKKEGRIFQTPPREKIKNLDELPFPAYHLFPLEKYSPTRPTWIDGRNLTPGSMMTSRGCPFECLFCFSQRTGFRAMSPQRVIEQIKFLVNEYKVNFVEFQDDVFNLLPDRSNEICKLMIKEDLDINWSIPNGLSRVENVTVEFLELAKKAGCIDVWFAGESGSDRVRNTIIRKRNTLQQVRDAVSKAKKVRFETGAFFVLGHPDESEQEMQQTIDFACSMPLDRAQFTIATPFPGTELYRLIQNAGNKGRFLETDWDFYGPYEAKVLFEYGQTKKEIVEKMYKKAFRQFYLRPTYIKLALKRKETYTNLALLIKEAVRFIV